MNNFASKLDSLPLMTIIVLFFATGSANAQQSATLIHPPSSQNGVSRLVQRYIERGPVIAPGERHPQSPPLPQLVDARNPNVINSPAVRMPGPQCAVPLLQVQPAAKTTFAIEGVTPRAMDSEMVVKPSVPACAERRP
jgi:hypothetical protein